MHTEPLTADQLNDIQTYIANFHLPRYRELPDIGLYLEQVTRYLNPFTPTPLTSSMVSNYVKQKIIPGPVKKAYSRDSLAYLMVLTYVKTVMSLEDMRLMIDVQNNSYSAEVAYNYFCDEVENQLQFICGLKEKPDFIGTSQAPAKVLLRTALQSITYKIYLDQIIHSIRERQSDEHK